MCRSWHNIECWLGSFVNFQGTWTSIARKPYILWFFSGGPDDQCCPIPSGSAHETSSCLIMMDIFVDIFRIGSVVQQTWILFIWSLTFYDLDLGEGNQKVGLLRLRFIVPQNWLKSSKCLHLLTSNAAPHHGLLKQFSGIEIIKYAI